MRILKPILLSAVTFLGLDTVAQTDPNALGTEITVVKPYTPSVSDAVKMNFKPAETDTATKKVDLKYSVSPRQYETRYEFAPIQAARISRSPLDKLHPWYIHGGIGSRSTSLAEVYFHSLRNKQWAYGVHAGHFASSGGFSDMAPSNFSNQIISAFGKRFYRAFTLSSEAHAKWDAYRYYGTADDTASSDSIRQRFFNLHLETELAGAQNPFNQNLHSLKLGFDHFQTANGLGEQDIRLKGVLGKGLGEGLFTLGAGLQFVKTQFDSLNQQYFDFGFNPQFKGSEGDIDFTLGLKAHVNSQSGENTQVYLYPDLEINYSLLEGVFVVYGGLGGGLNQITMRSLASKNPFISLNSETGVEDEAIRIYGGLKGSWSSKTSFTLGASFSSFNHMPLFFLHPDSIQPGRTETYQVVYDSLKRTRFFGELETHLGKRFTLNGAAFIDLYSEGFQEEAWHLPSFHGRVSGLYNLRDKILLKANMYWAGRRPVGPDGALETRLEPYTDLGLGITYRYNSMLSAFVEIDNLLNQKYEQFYAYRAQGFTVRGGISLAF